MPAYKRQHFLPVAYLKHFAANAITEGRKGMIWRNDGKEQRLVPIESQCFEEYHYSKQNAEGAEKEFHGMEGGYSACVKKINRNESLAPAEFGSLLLCAFDFYLRNKIHENLTGREGIDAYHFRTQLFWRHILLQRPDGEITKADIERHLAEHWSLAVALAPVGNLFLTSDHPSVWMCVDDEKRGLHLLSLPLTPTHVLFAYDKRMVTFTYSLMVENDCLTLNQAQLFNARQAVYSASDLGEKQREIIKTSLGEKSESKYETENHTWRTGLAGLGPEHLFSCFKRCES